MDKFWRRTRQTSEDKSWSTEEQLLKKETTDEETTDDQLLKN